MIERTSGHSARGSPRRSALRRHPVHVAVRAVGEEAAQPLGGLRDGVRPRDADGVEAVRARGVGERGLERGRRQKSRSA